MSIGTKDWTSTGGFSKHPSVNDFGSEDRYVAMRVKAFRGEAITAEDLAALSPFEARRLWNA